MVDEVDKIDKIIGNQLRGRVFVLFLDRRGEKSKEKRITKWGEIE